MNRAYRHRRPHRTGCGWLLTAALILLPGPLLADHPFKVSRARVSLEKGAYRLDADVDYRFNGAVLEALEHGIPLTLEVQVRVHRKDAWFWEKDVVDLRRYRVLRFHALTGLYEASDPERKKSQSFATRDAAISYLGEILMPAVVQKDQLEAGEDYILELRVQLDIESLPLTLRPLAYLDPDWNLSSKWSSWPL